MPGFNALYLGRAQLFSLGDTKTLSTTSVNEIHFSYHAGVQRSRQTARRTRSKPGYRRVSSPLREHPSIVALAPQRRRSGESRLQQFFDRHQHQRTEAGEQYVSVARQFLESRRTPHHEVWRRISLRPGQRESDCAVQRQLLVHRKRDGRSISPTSCWAFPVSTTKASSIHFMDAINMSGVFAQDSWRLKSEPHSELRLALGPHRALV